ncbi:PfkB [Penicillium italicum]|uniref:PfkB n=1 Tax=Penicillium italicum TaxID=40296 RepID=A0A0A2L991_PENIT|nr:PfkB [Penicillium italicum]
MESISFTSFGLLVLDEIRFPNRKPLHNVLGGSGAYATLGARLFLPSPLSRSLAWPIHVGNDFPDTITEHLHSWDTKLVIEKESDEPSTRGLLEYQDTTFGPKNFKYTTPVLTVQESKLQGTALLTSKVYHYLASPQDMKTWVLNILALREQEGIQDRPLIIWEPAPLSCKPENLEACLETAALVGVFSPNHLELAALFENSPVSSDRSEIERLGSRFLASGVGPEGKGAVVIRAGENGCFVQSRNISSQWLPPFYTAGMREEQAAKVVDPTGAGNAFLGGFAIGYLQSSGNILEAACYGSVAASFTLEQVGMPEKSNEGDEELWNGTSVIRRLHQYRARQELLQ